MFTGIVEEKGRVVKISKTGNAYGLQIEANLVLQGTVPGDSISVNGVCLTATHLSDHAFTVGVAPETLSRTNIISLKAGDPVNLERAVTPSTRLGGHYVQGHVDGTGLLRSLRPERDSLWVTIETGPEILKYIVPKGFISLDGTSLTVVDVGKDFFTVMLVAFTQSHIILPEKQPGYAINIEVDILGKYVEKLISPHLEKPSAISHTFLQEHDYQ